MSDARADFEAALPRYAEPPGREICELCRKAHVRPRDRYRCASCGRIVCRDEVRSLPGKGLHHRVHRWRDAIVYSEDCGSVVAIGQTQMGL